MLPANQTANTHCNGAEGSSAGPGRCSLDKPDPEGQWRPAITTHGLGGGADAFFYVFSLAEGRNEGEFDA